MPFTRYLAAKLLDHVFRGVVYTPPAAIYVGLLSVVPTQTTPGTELAGPDYARRAATWAAASSHEIRTSAMVVQPEPAAVLGAFVAVGFYDALTGGNLLAYCRVRATTIPAGQATYWSPGQLSAFL